MEILLAAGIFAVAVALLSLGPVLFRKPLRGSCGGIGRALGEDEASCPACGRSDGECPEEAGPSSRG